jgi:hypothetical protein
MGMKVIDLRPGNFEKACGFFSLFIIHNFFTIVLGGKYRDKNTNYHSRRGITYMARAHAVAALKICANFAISVNIIRNFI